VNTTSPHATSPPHKHPPAALLAALLVVILAAGCSEPGEQAPATGPEAPVAPMPYPPPRPDNIAGPAPAPTAPAPPATAGPDEVAQAGLRIMFTWYTGHDTGPASATRRALAYLAPPMSTDVIAAPPAASPGAQWDQWAGHHAVLIPTITRGGDDTPPTTTQRAYRQYLITQTVTGADGWTAPPQRITAFVTLAHSSTGWRIAQVDQS
jgi:hypothetical protein